jgi:dolichol-phosphate mannosyltransferase
MISVVIPLYNEEGNVAELQRQLRAALAGREYELLFVDDGSTDQTVARIERGLDTRVLELEKNAGQSAAMYLGFQAARGEIIAMLDGDLQNDPADLNLLLTEIEKGADLACGYRRKRRDNLAKKISSRVANAIRSRFVHDGVRDTGCSLKAMRRECRDALIPFKGMHRFIPALVKGAGYRIVEVGVNHRPRVAGESKYKFGSRVFRATADMFAVRWLLSRQLNARLKLEK